MVDEVMHPGEGDERLSGNGRQAPRTGPGRDKSVRGPGTKGSAGSNDPAKLKGDVGRALRSVYDSTLREEVPRDFLDLLGKLD